MALSTNTSMRFSKADKAMLKKLAKLMERTQGDTMRLLIRQTWAVWKGQKPAAPRNGPPAQSDPIRRAE